MLHKNDSRKKLMELQLIFVYVIQLMNVILVESTHIRQMFAANVVKILGNSDRIIPPDDQSNKMAFTCFTNGDFPKLDQSATLNDDLIV